MVGSRAFVERTKELLGIRSKGRKVQERRRYYKLRETPALYNDDFTPENGGLKAENTYFLDVYLEKSTR